MFTPDYFIDSVQNAKRYVVNTFVQDESIKKGLHAYIDAQTTFVKVVANNAIDFTQLTVDRALKTDYTKYFIQK